MATDIKVKGINETMLRNTETCCEHNKQNTLYSYQKVDSCGIDNYNLFVFHIADSEVFSRQEGWEGALWVFPSFTWPTSYFIWKTGCTVGSQENKMKQLNRLIHYSVSVHLILMF